MSTSALALARSRFGPPIGIPHGMAMSEKIEPALTAEEWRRALANVFEKSRLLAASCDPVKGNDHKRAALSLHDKPFGFTHEDVDLLRALIWPEKPSPLKDHFESLADRIEALLPPDSTIAK